MQTARRRSSRSATSSKGLWEGLGRRVQRALSGRGGGRVRVKFRVRVRVREKRAKEAKQSALTGRRVDNEPLRRHKALWE